ncbi:MULTISPECIES: lytic transglycosylase domain-containing protein [Yersinia]|uniref:lytic transglycosylase domain-containing protein n=1 Tax=Yersinia TaxID=629 RepID=UPI0011A0FCAA|nr:MULTISPECIES: lytic transglycosylase domain-containing protein [Yersinia]MBS0057775.1 lytic transglycosylase domain-containing protein [Yersinia sp. Marseille-Q3913]
MQLSLIALFGSVMLCLAAPAQAWCFDEAGARYHINAQLLRAIAVRESSLDPNAIGINRTAGKISSRDYGLMQINTQQLPRLKRLGIIKNEQDLLTNPCLNVQIGAWILAQHLQICGSNWSCLGSYNAGFSPEREPRRMWYSKNIYKEYMRLGGGTS